MAKRGRPPKKTRLDKVKALGSLGLAGIKKGGRGLGKAGLYGGTGYGLIGGSGTLEEGIKEGDLSDITVGTGETLGGIYGLREILKRIPTNKGKIGFVKNLLSKGLEYVPGGRTAKKIGSTPLPGGKLLDKRPALYAPLVAGSLGAEQAAEEIDRVRGKTPDVTYADLGANIFGASPEQIQPAESINKNNIVNVKNTDEEIPIGFEKITRPVRSDATETEDTTEDTKTETTESKVEEELPIISTDDGSSTDVAAVNRSEEVDVTPEKIVTKQKDGKDVITTEPESTETVMDVDAPLVTEEMISKATEDIKDDDLSNKILESPGSYVDYNSAKNNAANTFLLQYKMLEKFKTENQKTLPTFNEYYDRMKTILGDDTPDASKDFILLKLGLNLMSGRSDQSGFAGFLDIAGRAGVEAVDDLAELYQIEKARRRQIGSQFLQYEQSIKDKMDSFNLQTFNAKIGLLDKVDNRLFDIFKLENDENFKLRLEDRREKFDLKKLQMTLTADLEKFYMEQELENAKLNGIRVEDLVAGLYTNQPADNWLGAVNINGAFTKAGDQVFTTMFRQNEKGELKIQDFYSDMESQKVTAAVHNSRADAFSKRFVEEIESLNTEIKSLEDKMNFYEKDGKKVLFDRNNAPPNASEEDIVFNVGKIAKINKLKGKLESKKGTLLSIQNSKIPTGSLDLVKPSVPNYAPANLTDAENSLSMIDEALTFAEGANAVFEENVVGVRARVSSVILNLKDIISGQPPATGESADDALRIINQAGLGNTQMEDGSSAQAELERRLYEIQEKGKTIGVEDFKNNRLFGTEGAKGILEKVEDKVTQRGGKLTDDMKRSILSRLQIIETALVFTLANALKDQDRLTEQNLKTARELIPITKITSVADVVSKLKATRKVIVDEFKSKAKAFHTQGMKANTIQNLAPNLYKIHTDMYYNSKKKQSKPMVVDDEVQSNIEEGFADE